MLKRCDGSWRFGCTAVGATRFVIFAGRYVLKMPSFHSWRNFLWGLLGNMQEAQFARSGLAGICPVTFRIPGGLLNIMPYARPMTADEWGAFDFEAFTDRPDYVIPAERKPDSFGVLNGEVVAVDFGD